MKRNSRRNFLKKLAWGIPAGYVLPQYLLSCKDEQFFEENAYSGRVAIIGAGVAGLHAASILQRHGASMTIFEAAQEWGGRIRSEHNANTAPNELFVGNTPIELGADRIYGRNNLFYESLRTYTSNIRKRGSGLYYTYPEPEEGESSQAGAVDPEAYQKYTELERSLFSYAGEDMSLQDFLNMRQEEDVAQVLRDVEIRDNTERRLEAERDIRSLYVNVTFLWENLIGDQLGLTVRTLTIFEYLHVQHERLYASERYELHASALTQILNTKYNSVQSTIQFNKPVAAIDFSNEKVKLTIPGEEEAQEFDKVVIAVPVGVLDPDASSSIQGRITFTPGLPADKVSALSKIRMSPCAKVLLKFRQRFWPENIGALYTNTAFRVLYPHPDTAQNILMGYAYDREALAAEALDSNAGENVVTALGVAFPNPESGREPLPRSSFQRAKIVSWSENSDANANVSPYIPGAFSYTLPGGQGMRDVLAAPIGNKVFFAGEATHTRGHANTVHGAMETGYRAAFEIINNA